MAEENSRLAILDELDGFNTAPPAESIMQSILQEEEAKASKLKDFENFRTRSEDEPIEPTEPTEPVEPEGAKIPDAYATLNPSIQELRTQQQEFASRFSGLERSLQSLASSISAQTQQARQPAQEQYDPDLPITAAHMQTLAQRQQVAYDMSVKAYKQNISTRAHLEYQRFKSENPDFQFDPSNIDGAIEAMSRDGKLEQAEGANWRGQFEQLYAPQRTQKFEGQAKEIETLRKELEGLKKTAARTPSTPQPISPSTGRSSRAPAAISSPVGQSLDDKIVNMKSFRQKGNFKGYAKDLIREVSGA